jgi:hypothetical protein
MTTVLIKETFHAHNFSSIQNIRFKIYFVVIHGVYKIDASVYTLKDGVHTLVLYSNLEKFSVYIIWISVYTFKFIFLYFSFSWLGPNLNTYVLILSNDILNSDVYIFISSNRFTISSLTVISICFLMFTLSTYKQLWIVWL